MAVDGNSRRSPVVFNLLDGGTQMVCEKCWKMIGRWRDIRERQRIMMRELHGCIRAEILKMRHTLLPWVHILVPLVGITIFLLYYQWAGWSDEGKVSGYIQTIATVFPLIISIVCSISVEIEEKGCFQAFLGTVIHRRNPLLAKWLVLLGMGITAVLMAVGGFAAGYWVTTGKMVYWKREYMILAVVLWLCGINLYLFHLFLNLAFSKNISLCVGTAELLIAALFLTGLGEGLWQFFPCSWGGRWSGYLLLRWKGRAVMDAGMMRYGVCTGVAVTAGMWAVILLWFYFYEGRQRHD